MAELLVAHNDETGVDTTGRQRKERLPPLIFGTTLLTRADIESAEQCVEDIEAKIREEFKGRTWRKWAHSKDDIRVFYIEQILETPIFCNGLYYTLHENPGVSGVEDFRAISLRSVLSSRGGTTIGCHIWIDGQSTQEKHQFLMKCFRSEPKLLVKKLRWSRDEASPLIRVADMVCGWVSDAEHTEQYKQLLERAQDAGWIIRLDT